MEAALRMNQAQPLSQKKYKLVNKKVALSN